MGLGLEGCIGVHLWKVKKIFFPPLAQKCREGAAHLGLIGVTRKNQLALPQSPSHWNKFRP